MIFYLLIAFQLKHFIADYPLQTRWMLGKFKPGSEWILPLLAHASVHGLFSLGIILIARPSFWYLAFVDLMAHFIIDRIKASPYLLGRFKDMQQGSFWYCLGADQMAHHLTHYGIIYFLMKGSL